jgi:hypothetical protein
VTPCKFNKSKQLNIENGRNEENYSEDENEWQQKKWMREKISLFVCGDEEKSHLLKLIN